MQAWKDENVSRGGFHQNISYPRKTHIKEKKYWNSIPWLNFQKKKKKLLSYISSNSFHLKKKEKKTHFIYL